MRLLPELLCELGAAISIGPFFSDAVGREIEKIAKDIYELLFRPALNQPIKTLDLPMAGNAYTPVAFRFALDLINTVNDISPSAWEYARLGARRSRSTVTELPDDLDGGRTLEFLQKTKKAAQLILDTKYAGSLGLDPVVYFYGTDARWQPAAVLAVIRFFRRLESEDRLHKFTEHRHDFEEYLWSHRHFIKQLGHSKGSRTRSVAAIEEMYGVVFEGISSGWPTPRILEELHSTSGGRLKDLTEVDQSKRRPRRDFDRETKNEIFLSRASPTRCSFCQARLHTNAITIDHAIAKEDGGLGAAENGQLMHPFCNSGAKERDRAMAKKRG